MTTVTLIPGDGVGRECTDATLRILEAAQAEIVWEECEAGADVFRKGVLSGVPRQTIDSIARNRVVLKGPLETPVGYGEKSANVTLRKLFETFANVRPVREMPGVRTPFSGRGIDLVVVRENVEDLYAGIEHMQTGTVAQCLKLISRPGCEKVTRLAFELAQSEGRHTVHCATKSNIMKLTEGMLKRTFEEVAQEYPALEAYHVIVDNCAHQLVKRPEQFEVIVTTNMNGDILSDLTSGLIGGLGFAPSANLGREIAIFEAVHGSAPKYAGKDVINPCAVLFSAVMMLRHLQQFDVASRIEQAVMVTLDSGIRTRDVAGDEGSVSTTAFTDVIINNLGKTLPGWQTRDYKALQIPAAPSMAPGLPRRMVGVDVFVESVLSPDELGRSLEQTCEPTKFTLKMISNRGTKVYPCTGTTPDCVDHFRCRFMARPEAASVSQDEVLGLLARTSLQHRWMHVEILEEHGDQPGYTRAQGED